MPASKTLKYPSWVTRALRSEKPVILKKPMMVFSAITLVCFVAGPVIIVVYLLAAFYSLRGFRETVEAFTILCLILLGHPTIFSAGSDFRWLVFFASFGHILLAYFFLGKEIQMPRKVVNSIGLFFASTSVACFLVSKMPMLSMLKLVSFSMVSFTLIVAFYETRSLKNYWKSWFFTFIVFTTFASVLMFVTGMGYTRTANGFQGIWRHPQMMGPIGAVMTAWILGEYFDKNKSKLLLLCSLVGPVLIFISGARTAVVALAGGFLIAAITVSLRSGNRVSPFKYVFNLYTALLFVTAVAVFLLIPAQVTELFTAFVQKGDESSQSATELFQESRGELTQKSLENYKGSPIFGIGLGVPSEFGARDPNISTVFGIPTSFSTEKGFMPTAVLEELGTMGAVLLILLLYNLSLPIHRYGDLSIIWMYWTTLLVNIGAAILLSIGGLGLFLWFTIAYCFSQSSAPRTTNLSPRTPSYRGRKSRLRREYLRQKFHRRSKAKNLDLGRQES